MKYKLTKKNIRISEVQSRAKICTPNHSFVIIHLKNSTIHKQLFLASEQYKKSERTETFYSQWGIKENVDLSRLDHGNEKDTPEFTLPLFLKAASLLDDHLEKHNKVLVNCKHGRSRSGSVIALYLMEYCQLSADDAIAVVTRALKKRGYEGGIDIKGSYHGNYGDWLRNYEKQKLSDEKTLNNQENIAPLPNNQGLRRSKRLGEQCVFFPIKKTKLEATQHEALDNNKMTL